MKYFWRICITCLFLFYTGHITLAQNTVGVIVNKTGASDGYTLFTVHNKTYLIDNEGGVVNQWVSQYSAGQSVYLLENGNLLRAAQIQGEGKFTMPSVGGRAELFDWEGNLIWAYNYSTRTATQHHDLYPMPDGNILILAIEVMPDAEARKLGRKMLTPPFRQLYNEQVIELKPIFPDKAEIVWEWNVKDHLVQDQDRTKGNYGIISEHPHRLDINYLGTNSPGANWIHFNSVQYNAELDQIALTSKYLGEFYIIDHSTTTAEAATGSGGDYGRGGDFLYRWGNPAAYGHGSPGDRKLFGPHNAHWIGKGLEDEGKIIVYNNGEFRDPEFSEVIILEAPTRAPGVYVYKTGTAYGPESPGYTYTAPVRTDFYSPFKSSAQRLPGGHMLICEGESGHFFEIDEHQQIVWEYISPVGGAKMLRQGEDPADAHNIVFRATKYPPGYGAFSGRDLEPGLPIELPAQ